MKHNYIVSTITFFNLKHAYFTVFMRIYAIVLSFKGTHGKISITNTTPFYF